jgi:4-methyl-5(b-hydroxyethyl)-thiazole monophosphate biosynthesis
MAKTALLILSEDFEDIEGVAPVDILTRAGVEVTIAALKKGPVRVAYGNTIVPHTTIDNINMLYDAVILPGGSKNADNLAENPAVIELIKKHNEAGMLVAAICASPGRVLAETAGILKGKKATGFPDYAAKITAGGGIYTDDSVTVDGNIITGMGPGAAILFSLEIVEYLVSKQITDEFAARWRVKRE